MGYDIHLYVEYRKEIKKITKWHLGDFFIKDPFYKTSEYQNDEWERKELYGNRNYQLFATLAGVRDYTEKVVPVSECKGVPEDACDYVKAENESWSSDGHSHSWLTLKELRDYQAGNPIMYYTGLISPAQLHAFDTEGKLPNSWCQGTNQEGYERREWSEPNDSLIPLIEKLQTRAHNLLQHSWEEYDSANDENIRIVFWFDN